MKIEINGLDGMLTSLNHLADGVQKTLLKTASEQAKVLAQDAGNLVYTKIQFQDGAIRDSLNGITQTQSDGVSFGVHTAYDVAIYHEFGTGPVGTRSGYPGDDLLDAPLARSTKGWVYWSEHIADKRQQMEAAAGNYVDDYDKNGFVYTEGVPAKHFIHDAMVAGEQFAMESIVDALGGLLHE